jgi:hypothetical protein
MCEFIIILNAEEMTRYNPEAPSLLFQATITEDHRLSGLNIYFLQFWRLGRPGSRSPKLSVW